MKIGENQTLTRWIGTHAKLTPDAPAISIGSQVTSYQELHERMAQTCSGLAALGIQKGDVVAVQLPNCLEFVVAFLAIAARGAIMQTLHMPYRTNELRGLLTDSGAKAAIVTNAEKDSRARDILSIGDDLPQLKHIVVVGPAITGTVAFSALEDTNASNADIIECSADDRYLLLYTSGTTSRPKGVPHTYKCFLNNALLSASEMNIDPSSRILSLAALSHLYGLFTLHMSLAAGATSHLLPAFNPGNLTSDLKTANATHIYAAPAHFVPVVAQGLPSSLFDNTGLVCLSGAAVSPELAREVDDLLINGAVVQLWGMSELQAGTFGRLDDPADKRFATAGRAVSKTHIRVVDEREQTLQPGTEGSLQVKGPSVFAGYLNRPDENASAFTSDGWFRTGDLAIIDKQGYMALTGRVKELINRGGVKFNPVEVEEVLNRHPAIENCAIIPLPDRELGERGCLCVKLNDHHDLTLEEVKTTLAEFGMAKYKWPENLVVLNELPMTPTRKIMRGQLTETIKTQRIQDES